MATQNIEQQQRKLNAETLQNKLDMEEDQRKRRSSDMELTVDDSLLVEKNNGEDNSVKAAETTSPEQDERSQFLSNRVSQMRDNKKIAPDVNLKELVILTKNLNSVEVELLVRFAMDTALVRLSKAYRETEIKLDIDTIEEKVIVTKNDFLYALDTYITPIRLNVESLKPWLGSKIITWGPPVIEILEIGNLYAKVARKTGLFTVLLEGPPHSGKTTLAAHIAKNSNFEFFKVITPEDILNLDEFDNETAKCRYIREMFNEAYRASCSCILIDNIERLLNYCPIKQKYSTMMLQTLLVLLEKSPPPGHKLLILCTTNWTKCVDDLKLIPTFNAILEVPFLSTIEHVLNILTEVNLFSKHQMASFKAKLQEKQKVLIGIKNLLRLINIVREINSSDRVDDFLAKLEDEGELH